MRLHYFPRTSSVHHSLLQRFNRNHASSPSSTSPSHRHRQQHTTTSGPLLPACASLSPHGNIHLPALLAPAMVYSLAAFPMDLLALVRNPELMTFSTASHQHSASQLQLAVAANSAYRSADAAAANWADANAGDTPERSSTVNRTFSFTFFYPFLALIQSFLVSQESPRRHVTAPCGTSQNVPRIAETEAAPAEPSAAVQGATAPIVQALKSTAAHEVSCFHFPGHNRGNAAPSSLSNLIGMGAFTHDLPELPELDDLFYPKGVILDAKNRAVQLFGSSKTWFLVEENPFLVRTSLGISQFT
ncbi:hypothetical protein QYE76_059917 [Lolium multiflorum]|uniref:Orn/Lys/Arg decarboxylases family 1 pyridoxal-P attachment site domain-containing protein n=1 Tax=Lolium multiflorum TaxID=4521 RepID=A0AAD8RY44_LOLMU|nr:hypothetical protein QYE76_059917 [Lolium multiflorum]